MEFWAVEVKSGESVKVVPGDEMLLHLSQACLGEVKKRGNESVLLTINIDGKKLALGTLFADKLPQQQLDLVFHKDFELAHTWKNGSVYFYGYKASNTYDEDDFPVGESDESDSEKDIPFTVANNGKPELKRKEVMPVEAEKSIAAKDKQSGSGKKKVKIVEPKKDVNAEDDDESSEDDEDIFGYDDDSDDESDASDEKTPKKAEPRKKQAAESSSKTPVTKKKAKVTQQKTDGKKLSGHVATPYPSKQTGKTPANKPNQQTPDPSKQTGKTPANKPNQQTPKSGGGEHSCTSCNRTFGTDKALESHSKDKHGGGK